MRYPCSLLLALLLGTSPLLPSCGVLTPDTVHTEKQSDREQRIDSLLKDYDRRIKTLSTKIDAASGTAREELGRSLDDLKKKHQEATRKLEDLRNATNRSWKNVN